MYRSTVRIVHDAARIAWYFVLRPRAVNSSVIHVQN